ncbi:MAG: HAMP domain-containing histidine kinase [Bacteroidia bacterium]|nr:HAMP domain-containing histidine kinase [Bacteroidia bacterium]
MSEEAPKNTFFGRLADFWIPDSVREQNENARKARLLISFCYGVILVCFGYSIMYLALGQWVGPVICLYGGVSAVILLPIFKKYGNLIFAANFFAFTSFVVVFALNIASFGINSLVAGWILLVPLSAYLIGNRTSGLAWSGASVLLSIFLYLFDPNWLHINSLFPLDHLDIINFGSLIGLILFLALSMWSYEKGRENVLSRLTKAKEEIEKTNKAIQVTQSELEKKNREVMRMNLDLESEVRRRTESLERSNHELDTFLYESSHALRRPLARILGLIQILKTEKDPEQTRIFSSTMDVTARRMDILLHTLVRVSELSTYKQKIDDVMVVDLVETVWERMGSATNEGGFILEKDIPSDLTFRADISLLILVLENLLDNSIKYCKSGHVAGNIIRVTGVREGEWVRIRFWDNGLGIHPTMLPKLFDMFSRGTEKSTGSGLGLYLVRKIMEKMEGEVAVKSELGSYTEFELSFPSLSNQEGEGIWRAGSR